MSRSAHYSAPLLAGLVILGSVACGGGDGGGGPPDPDPGRFITTGPQPANLLASAGDLFWSEASETPVRMLPNSASASVGLVRKFSVPAGLALTPTDMFWTGERSGFAPSGCAGPSAIRTLHRTVLATSATTLLAAGDGCSGGTGDVVVDGASIFWVTSTSSPNIYTIRKMPIGGGAATPVATATEPIVALAADATQLYWMENHQTMGSAIRSLPLAGGAQATIVSGLGSRTQSFAINGTDAFYTVALYPTGEEVLRVPLAGGLPVPIDTFPTTPVKLAADATMLYLADAAGISALPVDGGTTLPLAAITYPVVDLLVDGTTLLWSEASGPAHAETGAIRRVPVGGGAVVTELPTGGDAPRELAVGAAGVYWTEGGPLGSVEGVARIARLTPGVGQTQTVASGVLNDTPLIAVSGSDIFIADYWRVKRVPRGGGLVETVTAAGDMIESLTTDGVSVFWVQRPIGAAFRAAATGGTPTPLGAPPPAETGPGGPIRVQNGMVYWMSHYSAILRIPTGGGSVTPVATGLPFLSDFVVDDNNVYYSENSGDIRRIPVGGGASVSLSAGGLAGSYNILAQDAGHIYWIDQISVGRVDKTGGNTVYLNPDALVADATFPASIAVLGADLAWTHPPIGVIQFYPK